MSKTRHLRDAYRHPGFIPQAILQAVEFDPHAFGIALTRRRKKRSAEHAVGPLGAFTISGCTGRAISTVLSGESFLSFSFVGFSVEVVGP
jgi:hypothetical protein